MAVQFTVFMFTYIRKSEKSEVTKHNLGRWNTVFQAEYMSIYKTVEYVKDKAVKNQPFKIRHAGCIRSERVEELACKTTTNGQEI